MKNIKFFIFFYIFPPILIQSGTEHVHNNLLGDCKFYRNLFTKKTLFLKGREAHHSVLLEHFSVSAFVFYLKMVEWNHRNMLWLK